MLEALFVVLLAIVAAGRTMNISSQGADNSTKNIEQSYNITERQGGPSGKPASFQFNNSDPEPLGQKKWNVTACSGSGSFCLINNIQATSLIMLYKYRLSVFRIVVHSLGSIPKSKLATEL